VYVTLEASSRVESPIGGGGPGKIGYSDGSRVARLRLPYHLVEPLVIAIDVVITIATCVMAGFGYNWFFLGHLPATEPHVAIGVLASINVSAVLAARGDYRVMKLASFYHQAREVAIVWSGVCLILIGIGFLLKISEDFSRGASLSYFAFGLGTMLVWRRFLARFLGRAFATGTFAPRKVIVIGDPDRLMASSAMLDIGRCGYIAIRTFQIAPEEFEPIETSERSRALIKDAIETARQEPVAEILLLVGWEHSATIQNIAKMLNVLPIPIYLLPDTNVARYLNHRATTVGTTLAAEIQRAPLTTTEQFLKRSFDLIGATAVFFLLSPLMLITALLIKLDSRGPVLFFQTRNGFNGREFRIVKFRTMYVLENGDHIRQATRADPRVTPLGRWLRRANIDELPQMLNVLIGDMSLVGPRPHAVAHNSEFEKLVANYAFRQHVKPGITGFAQVNGYRGETPTPELMAKRVDFDLWYIRNWSIWLDIRILLRTLILGLQPTAY
jgi:undecaprenyl-phosphate galactose phosphotransferase/putative colanic acid biosynthesis UDP-glucose lipid carrier transferase